MRQAHTDFGKSWHAAGLSFGDCFGYALAKVTGEPLPFKGRGFEMRGARRGKTWKNKDTPETGVSSRNSSEISSRVGETPADRCKQISQSELLALVARSLTIVLWT